MFFQGKVSIAAKPGEKLQIPDKKVIEDKVKTSLEYKHNGVGLVCFL